MCGRLYGHARNFGRDSCARDDLQTAWKLSRVFLREMAITPPASTSAKAIRLWPGGRHRFCFTRPLRQALVLSCRCTFTLPRSFAVRTIHDGSRWCLRRASCVCLLLALTAAPATSSWGGGASPTSHSQSSGGGSTITRRTSGGGTTQESCRNGPGTLPCHHCRRWRDLHHQRQLRVRRHKRRGDVHQPGTPTALVRSSRRYP